MSNDEYRAEQAERRQHGLKARHEQRLENATYTAAEVKVLTEAALRLGRKEAGEEIRPLLAPIDNALRNGSHMTKANLAFVMLCEQVGVDPTDLEGDPS